MILTLLLALAIPLSTATTVELIGDGSLNDESVNPDDTSEAFKFDVIYGGDFNITGDSDPGTAVQSFADNKTMFLNQTDEETGLNGYFDGVDIINVTRLHTGEEASVLNQTPVANFSSDIYFADGGVENNSVFDGSNITEGHGEIVVRSSTGLLTADSEVLVSGTANIQNFSEDFKFIDGGSGILDAGVYGNEVLIESENSVLNKGDNIYDLGGEYQLDEFESDKTLYLRENSSQAGFDPSNAIVRSQSDFHIQLQEEDMIVRNGTADMINATETNLIHSSTLNNFEAGDHIYYSKSGNRYVNESDVRLGDYTVSSGPTEGVSLSLDLLKKLNDSQNAPHTNDIGKSLETYDEGSFRVLEYGDGDGSWTPENDQDQDVLIYDRNNTGLTAGDVLLFDQDPDNGTVGAEVGEAFTEQEVEDTDEPVEEYTVSYRLGYVDRDDAEAYTDGDAVIVDLEGTPENHVVLGPLSESGTLTSADYNDSLGNVSRWNSDGDPEAYGDGIYVAMNDTGLTSNGDIRLAHWNATVELGDKFDGNGTVEDGDLDQGAFLDYFGLSDDVKVLDRDGSGDYDPGIGVISDSDDGREGIIYSENPYLNSTDEILVEGKMPAYQEWGQTGYFDTIQDGDEAGVYSKGEAIVDAPEGLSNDSEVLLEGEANITDLEDEIKYIAVDDISFDSAVDPVIYDAGDNESIGEGTLYRDDEAGSDDFVYTEKEAGLQNFDRNFSDEGDVKTVFLDSDGAGEYTAGEEILDIKLLRKGSISEEFDGVEIINFADSTRHTGEVYSSGEAIVNDTDMNGVYQNVVEGLGVENVVDADSREEFFTEANETVLDGGINVLRDHDDNWEEVGSLSYDEGLVWDGSFSENITEDTSFKLEFKAAPSDRLEDKAYGFRGEASLDLAGGSVDTVRSENTQVVDAHAPELVEAWTGDRNQGNSSATDRVYVKTNEKYTNLDYGTVAPGTFVIPGLDVEVEAAAETGNNDIEIKLNESIETDQELDVEIAEGERIRDGASNSRSDDSVFAEDGLRPEVENKTYIDSNEDGEIDMIEIVFSENITYSEFDSSDWNVEEQEITDLSVEDGTAVNNDTLILETTAEENITGVFQDEPYLDYSGLSVVDNSNNGVAEFNRTLSDGAAPLIKNVSTRDSNNDALLDRVDVEFTEPVDDEASLLEASSFKVDHSEITDVESDSAEETVLIDIDSDLSTGVTPNVTLINSTIKDSSENSITENQLFNSTVNTARPVLLHAHIDPNRTNYKNTYVEMEFSEPVTGDEETINISNSSLEFEQSEELTTRTGDFGQLLQTGDMPNITKIQNIHDKVGNEAVLRGDDNVTVNSFRNEVVEGWNFVSFPISDATSPEVDSILNSSKVDTIWTYRNQEWQIYDPEASTNDFDRFEGGVGYMINAEEDFVLNPNINTLRPSMTGEDLLDASTELENGYNLIGTFQSHSVPADNSDRGSFGAIDNEMVDTVYEQTYDGSNEVNFIRQSAMDDPGDMHPGEAYWMNWKGQTATYSEPVIGGE